MQFWLLAKEQEEEEDRERGLGNRADNFSTDSMQLNWKC